MIGQEIYKLAKELFPLNRSLTGNGVRETFDILKRECNELLVREIPTGSQCFDWEVPQEWNCNEAYILTPDGNKICDYSQNNLHIVQYSTPQNLELTLDELETHLFSLPEQPKAIPYITSYYSDFFGFCINDEERKKLKSGIYKIVIDSELKNGSLTMGDIVIKGESKKEILFSTYICHPSMGNNEISGVVVTLFLAKYIQSLPKQKYTYRFIFVPETIGSICYISKNLENLKNNIDAGFVVTCVGDNSTYSYISSRKGNTLADKVALNILNYDIKKFEKFDFTNQGSDERQYCSPKVDLPVCSVTRTKYGEYKEYHTSLDNMSFISPEGLNGAYNVYSKIIDVLEKNDYYKLQTYCEPQLGKRGLYPNLSTLETAKETNIMMNLLSYADGKHDLIDIANIIKIDASELLEILETLLEHKIIKNV